MERITRHRTRIMTFLLLLVMAFYAWRLYDLQIIETGGKVDNTTKFTTMTRVKAARGDILDRNGNVLVGNRASYDLVINHYVLNSATGTNLYLKSMVEVCQDIGAKYNDHFPMTMERPFTYTLDDYNSAWRDYFQTFLAQKDWDSDITAPLLIDKLRNYYRIPKEWDDNLARRVIGLRYELDLRGMTNLPTFIFLTDASEEARSAILELNVPGMTVESSVVREYHTPYAAHILGNIGKMNADQWEYYQDLPGYYMDADVGQSGLEEAMEQYLHGQDGMRIDVVTADGTMVESYYEEEPKAGMNVEITIDLSLQMAAEEALADQVNYSRNEKKPGSDGTDMEGAAAVAMDTRTGEVLACASYPTFDLTTLSENFDKLLEDPYKPFYNRALDAAYPPGSTYKMSMVVGGINSHVISPLTTIEDKGVFTKYADKDFAPKCLTYSVSGVTHGSITAKEALMVSCNYFFYVLGDSMSLDVIDATAKGLGLGEPTGIELDEEIGHRANEDTKAQLYEDGSWYSADQVLCAIGQSDNRFTPMQLCVYVSTLANRGTRYKATFLKRVVSTDYRNLVMENKPQIMSTMEISNDAYMAYSEGMHLAVSDPEGTAYDTFRDYPVSIAGKTGTAETGINIGSDNGAFVCYAPYDPLNMDAPEIAIAVYGEKAGHGSSMAGVAKSILDVYFAKDTIGITQTYENRPS